MATITRPVPFRGDAEQVVANRMTHSFDFSDPDTRCASCDCRPTGEVVNYPCGATVPTETFELSGRR